jgi:hypothetical protein
MAVRIWLAKYSGPQGSLVAEVPITPAMSSEAAMEAYEHLNHAFSFVATEGTVVLLAVNDGESPSTEFPSLSPHTLIHRGAL